MLNKYQSENRKEIQIISIEDLVPKDHILRDIDKAISFDFIYDEVKEMYSANASRPSVDPVGEDVRHSIKGKEIYALRSQKCKSCSYLRA